MTSTARENPEQPYFPNLYGGQVAAQAARAASLTAPEGRHVHSLHGYFLRAGSAHRPTILRVDRDRDGKSFSARHVNAIQDGEVIMSLLVSLHVDREGVERQEIEFPASVPRPEDVPEQAQVGHNTMFDLRAAVEGSSTFPGLEPRFWARTRGPLPDDRHLHMCVLTYLSDMGTGFAMGSGPEPMGGPSLDHAIWFHRPARLDEWVLVALEPIAVAGTRGYYTGAVFDADGTLIASIAQEHVMRPLPPSLLGND